ncbi:MAG: redoxin family protein [Capsulimonadales bacterium]|nr:redoxin family protein [Capsulimonadales bacterium]
MNNNTGRLGAAVGVALGLLLAAPPPTAHAQEKAVVVKDKLPAKAECFICSQNGEEHGEEKPAGAVAYKGKTYYFCSKKEVEAFVKDPNAYLPAPVPRPAPAFSLPTATAAAGEKVTLTGLAAGGKVLLVDFWATWCGPCVKAMPELQRLHQKYAAGGKFSVVGVSIDEEGAKKVGPFLAKQKTKYTYPILLDAAADAPVWQQWGVKAVPSVILVKDGQIVRHWAGKVDLKEVEKAVAEAVGS